MPARRNLAGARAVEAAMLALPLLLATTAVSAADPPGGHVRVALIARDATVAPGATMTLAIVLDHDPRWHTYWLNPGDSGQPTRLAWTLPDGATVREVRWPAPHRLEAPGIVNFVYEGETLVPVELALPSTLAPGARLHVALRAKWLECTTELCVPGGGETWLDVPIAARAHVHPERSARIARAQEAVPEASPWTARASERDGAIEIVVSGAALPEADRLDAFALQPQVLETARPTITREHDALVVRASKSEYFVAAPERLDLVLTRSGTQGLRAWQVVVPFTSRSTP